VEDVIYFGNLQETPGSVTCDDVSENVLFFICRVDPVADIERRLDAYVGLSMLEEKFP
jgi:hypothetical protein